uniref:Uncharacterized protein n=1 Tax=Candidatus Kentrum eta TaxID=2126337 RepID=A0A450W0R1_9GAMM|nr:MAG: hypothetical protein BECKH772A_GA0070896_111861 [Candidatus Kentron sp. H]VFK14009.1 MAG: hypothetical protein BECKH772C_GA0070978_112241 [Candidatus Kentron sp. H]
MAWIPLISYFSTSIQLLHLRLEFAIEYINEHTDGKEPQNISRIRLE